MTHDEYKSVLKRLMRQLSQRALAVEKKLRKETHYQNKRKEFIKFIDRAKQTDWFTMPKKGTRIYNVYYDNWI